MNDAGPQKPPWYSRVLPSTLEGRVALATSLLLITMVIAVWVVRWLGRDNVAFSHAMTTGRFLMEFGLAIFIPIVLYWGIRWWSRIEQEVFPDIDRAWKAGVDALYVNGLSLEALPVFLIFGSPTPEFENKMMAASLTNPRIEGVPPERTVRHALRWYASTEAIYLFCSNTSALSALAFKWTEHELQPSLTPRESRTPLESQPLPQQIEPATESPNAEFFLDTLQPELEQGGTSPGTAVPPAAPATPSPIATGGDPAPVSAQTGTVIPGTLEAAEIMAAVPAQAPAAVPPSAPTAPTVPTPSARPPGTPTDTLATMPSVDMTQHVERLQYVCQLLRQARGPRCGINGVLTLFPFQLAQASGRDLTNLAHAARQDIDVAQRTLGLRSPVTAMVVGLEREKGFGELIGRLEPSFRARRLGGRFNLNSRPTPAHLNSHSDRVCDAFEEWIYELFRQPDALARHRGNRKLYWLLSSIRHELKPSLRTVLGDAFGCEAATAGQGNSLLFSGCYFAAVAPNANDSAFLPGVVEEKLLREQSQVEWDRRSNFRERIFRAVVVFIWAVFGVLLGLLLFKF